MKRAKRVVAQILAVAVFLAGIGILPDTGRVLAAAPEIIGQPANASTSVGGTVTFSVTASDADSYQWKINGTSLVAGTTTLKQNTIFSGATTSTLTLSDVSAFYNGSSVKVDVTNSSGKTTTTSSAATLVVTQAFTGYLIAEDSFESGAVPSIFSSSTTADKKHASSGYGIAIPQSDGSYRFAFLNGTIATASSDGSSFTGAAATGGQKAAYALVSGLSSATAGVPVTVTGIVGDTAFTKDYTQTSPDGDGISYPIITENTLVLKSGAVPASSDDSNAAVEAAVVPSGHARPWANVTATEETLSGILIDGHCFDFKSLPTFSGGDLGGADGTGCLEMTICGSGYGIAVRQSDATYKFYFFDGSFAHAVAAVSWSNQTPDGGQLAAHQLIANTSRINHQFVTVKGVLRGNTETSPYSGTSYPVLTIDTSSLKETTAPEIPNATVSAGSASGATKVTATPAWNSSYGGYGDSLAVLVSSAPISTPNVGDKLPTNAKAYTPGSDIATGADAGTTKYIGVYEYLSSVGTANPTVSSVGAILNFTQFTVNGPSITTQPQSQTVSAGKGATFTVAASGSGLTYQWYKDGTAIDTTANSSAATSSLTISNVSQSDNGSYTVVVTGNTGTSVTSGAATLTAQYQTLTGYIIDEDCYVWPLHKYGPGNETKGCQSMPSCASSGEGIAILQPDGSFKFYYLDGTFANGTGFLNAGQTGGQLLAANFISKYDTSASNPPATIQGYLTDNTETASDGNVFPVFHAVSVDKADGVAAQSVTDTTGYLVDAKTFVGSGTFSNVYGYKDYAVSSAVVTETKEHLAQAGNAASGYGILIKQEDGTYAFKYLDTAGQTKAATLIASAQGTDAVQVKVAGSYAGTSVTYNNNSDIDFPVLTVSTLALTNTSPGSGTASGSSTGGSSGSGTTSGSSTGGSSGSETSSNASTAASGATSNPYTGADSLPYGGILPLGIAAVAGGLILNKKQKRK